MPTSNESFMGVPYKWLAMVTMIAQTVGMVILLRLSRTQATDGPRYLNTTAVFFSEVLKFVVSTVLLWCGSTDLNHFRGALRDHFLANPLEFVKTGIPALLYAIQTNLLYVAISCLPAGIYQVLYQGKILTTAGLSVLMLGTRLDLNQWVALVMLTVGVALCGSAQAHGGTEMQRSETTRGILAVAGACFTTAFAGVYIEKILKQSSGSIWVKNMQLSTFGMMFTFAIVFMTDGPKVAQHGFMQGYCPIVWVVVLCQCIGGLAIAVVLKYADNIIKCFGIAIAMVITFMISTFVLQEMHAGVVTCLGVFFVITATVMYSSSGLYPTPRLPARADIKEMPDELKPLIPSTEKTQSQNV